MRVPAAEAEAAEPPPPASAATRTDSSPPRPPAGGRRGAARRVQYTAVQKAALLAQLDTIMASSIVHKVDAFRDATGVAYTTVCKWATPEWREKIARACTQENADKAKRVDRVPRRKAETPARQRSSKQQRGQDGAGSRPGEADGAAAVVDFIEIRVQAVPELEPGSLLAHMACAGDGCEPVGL